MSEATSGQKTVRAALVGVVLAGIVLVGLVLPAGFGIDPLGIGGALGLTGSSPAEQAEQPAVPDPADPPQHPGSLVGQPSVYKQDSITFTLGPEGWIEYKYRMEKGGSMVYSWKATGKVQSEMHSEPDDGPQGYAEFFEKGELEQGHGTYTAPFPGIHGWYWKNLEPRLTTITLISSGFYEHAREFREDSQQTRELPDAKPGTSN